uniref:Phosphatidylinositol-glycan biosynthesis class F protein n=1 Tax=Mesocestoides corti TaxID=53468 RepID=A0A5K3FK39_MESCO
MIRSTVENLSKFSVYYFCYSFIVHITFILFGAPVFSNVLETLCLSLWFAFLSGAPFLWQYEPTTKNIRRVLWDASTPHEYFACCSFWGTLVGTWSSAFVLVLDWDRPWQAWPIPCVMGAVIGFSLGFFAFLLRRYLTHPFVDRSRCYVNTGDSVKVNFE